MDDDKRIFHVDDVPTDDKLLNAICELKKALKEYRPQLYALLRPIIGHDAPWTDEEYDHAVTQLVWGGEE